jgi:hypothetical protein
MHDLNWQWILVMLAAPPLAGLLIALPIWRTGQAILGNLAGAAVIFGSALALILREYAELDQLARACLDTSLACAPTPSAFVRYAIYAVIGLLEVFGLFTVSLRVEDRVRNRHYAPEWR